MRWRYIFLFFMIFTLWGCPTKRLVPERTPPQPQTMGLNFRQLDLLGGMAPLVGPAPYFLEMLASDDKWFDDAA